MSIGLNKACELADFRDPELRSWIRNVFAHELTRFGSNFPDGVEYRKHWEVAMTAMALSRVGALHPGAEVLGVGAGNEPTLFWLTNHVRRVFATDLYLDHSEWNESAHASMLVDPGSHWIGPWRRDRLVVQHMDARSLHYEAESFDAIFSSSSLEHFGTRDDVMQAVREMRRVLRPGGLLCFSTELRLRGDAPGLPGILMFDQPELNQLVVENGPWELVDPLDVAVSQETLVHVQDFADSAAEVTRHVENEGKLVFHRLDWSAYPQLVLRADDLWWTSVHLALRRVRH